jgi:DNA-binding transcriptional regulator YiaG
MKNELDKVSISDTMPTLRAWTPARIQQLREKAGMSQEELAAWLGVLPKHVSHLETGFRSAGTQTARLLDILAVCVESKRADEFSPQRKRGKQ